MNSIDFHRISDAIHFISENYRSQPDLKEIAARVHLSPYHFQRLFTQWAGVSPKQFQRFVSLEYAKSLLVEQPMSLFDIADRTGLSGTGRLHDMFVKIEGMTPGEYKNGGSGLSISFEYYESAFGLVLIGSTKKGICWLSFEDDENELNKLKSLFPNAQFINVEQIQHREAVEFLRQNVNSNKKIRLHLKGTDFQLKVWNALLTIPEYKASTYGQIGSILKQRNAGRAVGSAVGKNPVAYIIPCHRVIRSTGAISGYRWGVNRKRAILGWEGVKSSI